MVVPPGAARGLERVGKNKGESDQVQGELTVMQSITKPASMIEAQLMYN